MADKTIGFAYGTETQVLGVGDAYVTLSGTTEQQTDAVDVETWGGVVFRVEVNFDSTPTDNINVMVYRSSDGTTYDTTGQSMGQIGNNIDPGAKHYAIEGEAQYIKIGVAQNGSTDSHDVRVYATSYRRQTADV